MAMGAFPTDVSTTGYLVDRLFWLATGLTGVAKALLTLSKKFGQTIPLTKHELAELANTTQETTIRILSQLSRQRIIRSSRGNTTILSLEKLSALLDRS